MLVHSELPAPRSPRAICLPAPSAHGAGGHRTEPPHALVLSWGCELGPAESSGWKDTAAVRGKLAPAEAWLCSWEHHKFLFLGIWCVPNVGNKERLMAGGRGSASTDKGSERWGGFVLHPERKRLEEKTNYCLLRVVAHE